MNWLFATKEGGTFILRIDDTDLERSTNEYEQGIKTDLAWLGMEWGETFNQSHRFPSYEAAAEKQNYPMKTKPNSKPKTVNHIGALNCLEIL